MIKPYPHVTQHFVGKPADHHECALLRAELAAQARDIHVMSLEIARLRPYEHTLKHAVELAEQGRGADALGLRPFDGGDAYQVKAFLRYRIDRNTGQIVFWFELQRPDRVLEDASKAMVDKIKTSTGLPVIFGTPE